ncbi:predicted protein [Lichtheimia corymbifera JMRC:FSU:9682]|uniref:Uncharacterized protein n=1 Tax=Lichtheimia corymbifera JMRC:FSU:9682 TaxID=1263082 RepID=A0A068S1M9_9FUNG|nr:predicted protein [Lichtheimia corymbifera JMRC:FSU:9682]
MGRHKITIVQALDLHMRLDIRVITTADEVKFDALTGEAATTKEKYFCDKLKSVLATKCHMNHFIRTTTLTATDIKQIRMSIIQIMGTSCQKSNEAHRQKRALHGGQDLTLPQPKKPSRSCGKMESKSFWKA